MTRHRFYVGTQGNGGAVRHDLAEAYLVATYGGFSAYRVEGAWRDGLHSPTIREESIVYECVTDESICPSPEYVAKTLRDYADQQYVLYTVETVQGGYV